MTHPARALSFSELSDGLRLAVAEGLVSEVADGDLRLYCYTRACVYERKWTPFATMARGLIIDCAAQRVVATPFPKFFNVGERGDPIPDLPFEVFEKVDGSLIVIFYHNGEWRAATKGAFRSGQAQWATDRLSRADLSALDRETTYLAEAVYAANRIVIHYDADELVMLAAYDSAGIERSYDELRAVAGRLGWRCATRHAFTSFSDLLSRAETLPATQEGFVVRFSDGRRLKVKGDEYKRIHALVSRVTPLAMWEAMQADDDMARIRADLPEEFWGDFDGITAALRQNIEAVVAATQAAAEAVAHLPDKDVGLRLGTIPAPARGFIFPYRKSGGDLLTGRTRQSLFRAVRPTGNRLVGYVPSYAIGRVLDDAA